MKKGQKKQVPVSAKPTVLCLVVSRREAAELLAKGTRHLHSSALGDRDPLFKVTEGSLDGGVVPTYSWENYTRKTEIWTQNSAERSGIVSKMTEDMELKEKRYLRERLESILEEVLTNAFYHAYTNPDGSEKYLRSQSVLLPKSEALHIEYFRGADGMFLSVEDKGGSLRVDQVLKSISRCYEDRKNQIEQKIGGAGLGTYFVFEMATHIKIVVEPGIRTCFSLWVADKNSFVPENFSFNYFERGGK